MTERQHKIFFLTLLLGCLVLTLTLDAPTRNYVPVIWTVLGFGLHGFWTWSTWIELSKRLIIQHQNKLDELRISYIDNRFKTTVNMFSLLQKRKRIENISSDIKMRLSFFRTYLRLTIIAFLVTAILGLTTVMMTWNWMKNKKLATTRHKMHSLLTSATSSYADRCGEFVLLVSDLIII